MLSQTLIIRQRLFFFFLSWLLLLLQKALFALSHRLPEELKASSSPLSASSSSLFLITSWSIPSASVYTNPINVKSLRRSLMLTAAYLQVWPAARPPALRRIGHELVFLRRQLPASSSRGTHCLARKQCVAEPRRLPLHQPPRLLSPPLILYLAGPLLSSLPGGLCGESRPLSFFF